MRTVSGSSSVSGLRSDRSLGCNKSEEATNCTRWPSRMQRSLFSQRKRVRNFRNFLIAVKAVRGSAFSQKYIQKKKEGKNQLKLKLKQWQHFTYDDARLHDFFRVERKCFRRHFAVSHCNWVQPSSPSALPGLLLLLRLRDLRARADWHAL